MPFFPSASDPRSSGSRLDLSPHASPTILLPPSQVEDMYDDEEDRGALCCSRICLFLVGCGLLGAGSHFMVASETPERQEKVLQYDTTVQEWNDIKREQFAASTFSLKATVPGMGTKSMPLLEDTSDDHAIQIEIA